MLAAASGRVLSLKAESQILREFTDGEGGAGAAGGVGQYPGETDAERAERLGKELDESVGDFDEVLMEEQREISTVGRNTEGFGTGGSGGSGGIDPLVQC